jgi:hypothetical protein
LWRRGTTGRSVICLDRSAIFFTNAFSSMLFGFWDVVHIFDRTTPLPRE